jgi:hypothetical protein
MDIRRSGRLSLLLVSLAAGVSSAQEASLEPCPQGEDTGGGHAFLGFDRELRAALSSQDPTLLAVLAAYPLRVNAGGGTTSIDNAWMLRGPGSRWRARLPRRGVGWEAVQAVV